MKKYILFILLMNAATMSFSQTLQPIIIDKTKDPLAAEKKEIDRNLRINYPAFGQKVRGKIMIKGSAKPGSMVSIKITSTYYKIIADQKRRKILKGDGPLPGIDRTVKIKTNGQGFWQTNFFDFRNSGWSEEFKIVARSVEGNNATYVIVKDETKPIFEWD